ncbi:aquaporin Z [Halomonas sabkhae]|uniref:aquaporin Z n=1 Tax=Halomonas sabkhae TaxID=626223 RepID=UPI0025B62007|nr:aquaporin Z [Halomonas sabkhae]MDN3524708.1 aquaporin Z [Halomonas sabkhae]
MERYIAEFIGTLCLVLFGCGSIVLSASFPSLGIGLLGIALAFGLTMLTMALAISHISGCHLNPAVSIGLWAGGRFPGNELPYYIASQLMGALIAAGMLYLIASGKPGFDFSQGFGANGYGEHSPGGYDVISALLTETLMTMIYVFVMLGATDKRAPARVAPFAAGLCLTMIYLISVPITNGSINPARSTSAAMFVGDWAMDQLWLFWIAPMTGALLGAVVYRMISGAWQEEDAEEAAPETEKDPSHIV